MVWSGLIVGASAFLIIGIFHPVVVKCEYHFTDRVWPLFLLGGLACCAASLFIQNVIVSSIVAVFGCCMVWSVGELKHQTQRVRKGWFPQNPKRMNQEAKEE